MFHDTRKNICMYRARMEVDYDSLQSITLTQSFSTLWEMNISTKVREDLRKLKFPKTSSALGFEDNEQQRKISNLEKKERVENHVSGFDLLYNKCFTHHQSKC